MPTRDTDGCAFLVVAGTLLSQLVPWTVRIAEVLHGAINTWRRRGRSVPAAIGHAQINSFKRAYVGSDMKCYADKSPHVRLPSAIYAGRQVHLDDSIWEFKIEKRKVRPVA